MQRELVQAQNAVRGRGNIDDRTETEDTTLLCRIEEDWLVEFVVAVFGDSCHSLPKKLEVGN